MFVLLGALYCDVRSGFEVLHGLLERIMTVNGIHFGPSVKEYRINRAKALEKREAARKALEAAEKKKAAKNKGKKDEAKSAEASSSSPNADAVEEFEDDEWKVINTFTLRKSTHPSYFPGRVADIVLHRLAEKDEIVIGQFGILHPDVIQQFDIPYVCSALEINLEYFL